MPAAGFKKPSGLPALILTALTEEPQRARDIAAQLPRPEGLTKTEWSVKIGQELTRMTRKGDAIRVWIDLGYARETGHYRIP